MPAVVALLACFYLRKSLPMMAHNCLKVFGLACVAIIYTKDVTNMLNTLLIKS